MPPRKRKSNEDSELDASEPKRTRDESPDHSDTTLNSQPSPPTDPNAASTSDAHIVEVAAQMTDISQTVGPPAATVVVIDLEFEDGEVDYVPDTIIPRLLAILNFSDPAANRFAMGLAPEGMAWGAAGTGNGLDKYLCFRGRPVTLWMLGIVASVWLIPTDGTRVSIGVRLLCRRDREAAARLLHDHCEPRGDASSAGLVTYANRFLGNRGGDTPSSFQDVFDASQILEPWSSMTRISPDRVRKTDIVLVECYVRRFRSRENTSRFAWNTWAVNFELLRIAHLLRGPGPTELVPEESNVAL